MSERLLRFPEAAHRLGVTENTLRWMVHTGTAPESALIGRRRVFKESDIEGFIADAFPRTRTAREGLSPDVVA